MGRKAFIFLFILAVALGGTYLALQRQAGPTPGAQAQAWLPALQGRLADIDAIEVQRPGQPPVHLARRDSTWVVVDKAGYPADARAVADLLRALGEARRVEARTAKPELHAQLGLAEKPGEGQALRLVVRGQNGLPQQGLLIGKPGQQGKGQLVRLPGDNQSWLIDRRIELPETELAWLDRRIAAIPFSSVRQVEVRYPQGKELTVYRDAENEPNMKVRQLPAGRKLAYEAAANGMAAVFAGLQFADAAPLDQVQFKDKPLLSFELQTFAGGRLTGELLGQGEQYWLRLTGQEKLDDQVPGRTDWAYLIEPFQYQALARKLEDLLSAK